MAQVRIVTDSTADLPPEVVQKYGITVVPLTVFFGSESFLDGVDLTKEEFFRRLASSKDLPTTSQPTPAEFAEVYRPMVEEGADIVSIHISTHMSGTVQSAQLAKTMLNYDALDIIDSQAVSVMLGMVVVGAARAAAAGYSRAEVTALAHSIMANHRVYFMVDTLEYLQRGGRIGKAQAFLGSVLNVKPVCTLKEGIIYPQEKVRGRKKAILRMVELVSGTHNSGEPMFCFLTHGNDPEGLEYTRGLVKERVNCAEMLECQMGSVVGTHAGPGILGVAVCPMRYMQPEA